MKLNETIRRLRRAKGLTQEQVAQALGVSGPAVNKWERGVSHSYLPTKPIPNISSWTFIPK